MEYVVNYYFDNDQVVLSIGNFRSEDEANAFVKKFEDDQKNLLNLISEKFDIRPPINPYMKVQKVIHKNNFSEILEKNSVILTGNVDDLEDRLSLDQLKEWEKIFKGDGNLYLDVY